jgi:hypothetical protein
MSLICSETPAQPLRAERDLDEDYGAKRGLEGDNSDFEPSLDGMSTVYFFENLKKLLGPKRRKHAS